MIANDVITARKLFHHFNFLSIIILIFLCLTNQLFEGIFFFRVQIFDEENVSISSFSDLVDLFESFSIDVESSRTFEKVLEDLKTVSHYYTLKVKWIEIMDYQLQGPLKKT